jgi:hypothetical protein
MNVPSNISMQLVKRLNTWDVISANGEVIARFGLAHRRLAEAFPLLRQIGDPPVKALGSDPSATPLQNRQIRNCPMQETGRTPLRGRQWSRWRKQNCKY